MDQEKITKAIKENRGILKQLTSLNNEVKELKDRIRKLEKHGKGNLEVISGLGKMSKVEIANIKVGLND